MNRKYVLGQNECFQIDTCKNPCCISFYQQQPLSTILELDCGKSDNFDELTEHPPSLFSPSCMQISGWSVYLFYGSTLSSWDRRNWQALTKEQVAFLIVVDNHQNEEDRYMLGLIPFYITISPEKRYRTLFHKYIIRVGVSGNLFFPQTFKTQK